MKAKLVISEPSEVVDPLVTELAACIQMSKRVLVVTGAGISCSSGIPVSAKELNKKFDGLKLNHYLV